MGNFINDNALTILFVLLVIWFFSSKWNKSQKNGDNNSRQKAFQNKSVHPAMIDDKFKTVEEVEQALRTAGLEASQLIVGIDFTRSNMDCGRYSFGGKSLHTISRSNELENPYQKVIRIIGRTLQNFDDDHLIPAFGFGDIRTTNKSVFPFYEHRYCNGFEEVLERYSDLASLVTLSGPTNFAPLIRAAVNIVKETGNYHILLIIGDGAVVNERETADAIVEASHHPLSIVMVGVGDGPFHLMEEFDDRLPQRLFDNFQFVNATELFQRFEHSDPELEARFARQALMEIPDQYRAIRQLGLLA